jgi:hypothetical protein
VAGLKRAQAEFAKAGLSIEYRGGEQFPLVQTSNTERWGQVSCMKKCDEWIPMTTNCLESLNGHANQLPPRPNILWASGTPIALIIGHGIQYFGAAARHNFDHANRRAFRLTRAIEEVEMNQQGQYYGPDVNKLTCGWSVSTYCSQVLRQFIPSCHLFHLVVPKGRMAELPVLFRETNPNAFRFGLDRMARPGPEPSRERKDALFDITARSIKHLSKTGVKLEEAAKWVQENCLSYGDIIEYVQNVPVPFLELICAGVLNYIKGR